MSIKPLTLKEVQRMVEVTGRSAEYIIDTLPSWVREDPEWSAAVVRTAERHRNFFQAELGRGKYCTLDDLGIVRTFHSCLELTSVTADLCTKTISIHDNENNCFLRYETAPALVESEEIILEGYEFEPLTLAEAWDFWQGSTGFVPEWQLGSAAWSAALARGKSWHGIIASEKTLVKRFLVLSTSGTMLYFGSESGLLSDKGALAMAASIHDSERDIFVRPSTEPRLVPIDPS